MGNFKGTKVKVALSPNQKEFIADFDDKYAIAKVFCNSYINAIEVKANAELIVDAFNTTNECNLIPSEILNQRNEMLEAVKELLPIAMEFINENHPTYKKVTELIKKATE